jgi:diaminopimelate epimerase
MNFTKMQGLGNDFIVVANFHKLPDQASQMAVQLCDRHFGIGADGLVFILPSEDADFMMRIINADGSEAEQCGNAIRCVAKYIYDRGLTDSETPTIETIGAGVQQVTLKLTHGVVDQVCVDMGVPVMNGLQIPTVINQPELVGLEVEAGGDRFALTAVSMGNPHGVIFVDDAATFDVDRYGPLLETHELFPNKANIEFVTVRSADAADMRVWERGAGQTLACGTGACATLVAGVLNGKLNRTAVISLKGGDLHIAWNEQDNRVYMTGPAAFVYDGHLAVDIG